MYLKNILLFVAISTLQSIYCSAQEEDWSWWGKGYWDGNSHWSKYIITSAARMGPNALPVPEIKNGLLPTQLQLSGAVESHFSSGDHTQNLFSSLYIPVTNDKIGIQLSMVPVEYYQMDTTTRNFRRARDFDGKGFSVGDVYIGTFIQLVKNKKHIPDMLLTINIKTASGNNLAAARFTDSPGYFFDLSVGKTLNFRETSKIQSLRLFGMGGFYVYQTYIDNNPQNDGLLFGIGASVNIGKIILENHFGGFHGYFNNGDRPMVNRFMVKTKLPSAVNYRLTVSQGIKDFPYTSLQLGVNISLKLLKAKSN